jgi:hypothetical protein
MQEDRVDKWLREAARSYHEPPEPDLDQMWAEIERRQFVDVSHRAWWTRPGVGIAAALIIGVGIGRVSLGHSNVPTPSPAVASVSQPEARSQSPRFDATTSRYLDQTAALLVSLPSETGAGKASGEFVARAHDLLLTTRILLNSPAAANPKIRALLDDLEMVLAQIGRLQEKPNSTDLDLIHQALRQRDVMPRLHTAVADFATD